VEIGGLGAVEATLVIKSPAVKQAADDLQRLVHPRDLLAGRGPVHPARRLVERLARANPKIGAARTQLLQRRDELGDDGWVVAVDRCGDAGADADALGRLADRAKQRPSLTRLARLPPRLKVIADIDRVEASVLGGPCLAHQCARRELLSGKLRPVAHGGRVPPSQGR
jgi:hypothetical protein